MKLRDSFPNGPLENIGSKMGYLGNIGSKIAKATKGKIRRTQKIPIPKRTQIAMLLVVGFLAMIGYWISQSLIHKPPVNPAAAIGGSFTLVNHEGRPVTEDYFKGRFMLVYFGYTFCPDVCPTALTNLGEAFDILGQAADKVTPVFISVDPDRDTPEYMREYLKFFHPRLVGLTGTPEQTAAVLKSYKAFSAKAAAPEPEHEHLEGRKPGDGHTHGDEYDYLMDHTSIIYLMGPDGAYKAHFSHGVGAEDMAKGIQKFL
jgi:protein SCO1/2